MTPLAAYLDLTPTSARAHWAGIVNRGAGHREDFTPVETLLCFGLFFVLKPNSYGGGNLHRAPAELPALAAAFRRSVSSLLLKMGNLEGSRRNGARAEWLLFTTLSSDHERFDHLYTTVIVAAREAGLGSDAVPDFLGVLGGDTAFLGQEELVGVDLEAILAGRAETHCHVLDADVQSTSRLLEMRVRVGQSRFARQVLTNYGHACAFCGFSPGDLRGLGLLVASHIKPWAKCDDRERLDGRNGLAACPMHDRAFDQGLLLVNGGLRVHRSPELVAQTRRDGRAEAYFGDRVLAPTLLLPEGATPPGERYLAWHKAEVWRGVKAG